MTVNPSMLLAEQALTAATQLRGILQEIHQHWGADVVMSAGLGHIGIVVDYETGNPDIREALAETFATASSAETHIEIDPDDLWVTLSADGQRDGVPVRIALAVPPATQEAR